MPSKRRKRKKKKDPNAPKGKMSAYMFFNVEKRKIIKEENPEYKFGDLAKEVSKRWKALTDEEKEPYIKKSIEDKERFETQQKIYLKNKPESSSSSSSSESSSSSSSSSSESSSSSSSSGSSSSSSSDRRRKKKKKKRRRKKKQRKKKRKSKKKKNKKRKKKDPNAPKGKRSAYNFYSSASREKLKEKNPDLKFGDLATIISKEWREMSEEQKKPYQKQSDEDKERYEREMKEYKKKN
ncbi:high mobility group protein dsp1 [Anaeramoeba flamelloides]|uniref:High mobility group protein dsp1 n=1 Tax=Anaeramoeba flamelloides TaxID=1746091 RepID=A0AAV7YQJ5_9EUKA|nr:high mobility group protein dsp1 [Anaeramoeba flamelloides]